jgi:ribonucleoside-diphosphate reductase alpha chain
MTEPIRSRMPVERKSITRVFRIRYKHKDGSDDIMHIYLTAGLFEDGSLGELFIKADRMGTMARGALDAVAVMISLLLQYGVPVSVVVDKLRHTRYEPSGFTGDEEFKTCTSVLDLVSQWIAKRFGNP